jgi:hypothetical protein
MANVPPPLRRGKGEPPPQLAALDNLARGEAVRLKPLNFKVPADFHREFKTFAAMNGMSMLSVLTESFRLYREHKG